MSRVWREIEAVLTLAADHISAAEQVALVPGEASEEWLRAAASLRAAVHLCLEERERALARGQGQEAARGDGREEG